MRARMRVRERVKMIDMNACMNVSLNACMNLNELTDDRIDK